MLKKNLKFLIGIPLITVVGTMLSCSTDRVPLATQNSLPQDRLTYYSDDFDEMREDLWDRAGYLYRKEQVQNFKQADMRFDNGNLILRTKTGSFSKGGLASKYVLRGDFDIQLDCRMDLIVGSYGMDHLFGFGAYDKALKIGKMNFVSIGLSMKGGSNQGTLFSNSVVNGRRKRGNSEKVASFNGSFRLLRNGKYISTLYKKRGTVEWTKMDTFRATDKDMLIGFQLRNFSGKRTKIRANHSISVEIDSLKINAAQAIIEDEI